MPKTHTCSGGCGCYTLLDREVIMEGDKPFCKSCHTRTKRIAEETKKKVYKKKKQSKSLPGLTKENPELQKFFKKNKKKRS